MSAPRHEAPKPTPRSSRRWLRFSLRTLLVVMTLVCVGIVAKQKYDWHRRQQLIHGWIAPLVDLARAADGDITRYPDDPPQLTPPAGLPAEEQIPLLRWGIVELETPEERLAALKILVESHGEEAVPVVRALIPECRHGELQATLLHLLSLERNPEDLPLFEKWLDSPSEVVRGAAAESMGYVHQPAYGNDWSWTPWNHKSRLNTLPPITVRQNLLRLGNVSVSGSGDGDFRARGLIEGMMLNGQTVAERTAAARALIGWPPAEYSLRVAEWGVWIDEGGERLTTKGVLEEIPGFVHRTGNSLASLPRNRVELQLIVTKPIIHLTADRPLAVDLEISIAGGRPRYAFPRPDTLTFHSQDAGAEYTPTLTEWDEMEAKQLAGLQGLLEGYPWIHPADRMNDAAKPPFWVDNLRADAVGMRWQSLIVSPQRQTWMSPPAVSADPKFRWWEQLRDVPSAWVTSQGETERFLYYDGPTTARSPLEAVRKEAALKLTARDVFDAPQADSRRFGADRKSCVFIDSQQSPPRGFAISPVDTFGSELSLQFANQTWLRGDEIETTFREMLLEEGLTKEEAAGLLDSWRERFFQAPGQRLLTLLTRSEYDRMCPLKVRPPATETVRVGIVLREF